MTKQNEKRAVNIGTNNKFQLQNFALKFMKTYPKDKTAKQYASLLCWDIGVTQRTAFESYIEPMIEHEILIPSGSNCYRLNSDSEEISNSIQDKMLKLSDGKKRKPIKKQIFKCLNCGKPNENRLYCNEKCYSEYHSKKKNKDEK